MTQGLSRRRRTGSPSKIELGRPDRALRRRIWDGEIKNVIVNAARLALTRGGGARVSMADFQTALKQEQENRWGAGTSGRLGFSAR